MADRKKRLKNIFGDSLPIDDPFAMKRMQAKYEMGNGRNEAFLKFGKDQFEKAQKTCFCQDACGLDFTNEQEIRHFLREFNKRAWVNGIRSMPEMFNITESFFDYKRILIYFELLEEESYNISLLQFLDYATDDSTELNEIDLFDSIEPNLIYHFNITQQTQELEFKTDKGKTYYVGNISLVRRDNEVTVLLYAGELYDKSEADKLIQIKKSFAYENQKQSGVKKEIKLDPNREIKVVNYLDREDLWLNIAASRFDLNSKTIDVRYLVRDLNAIHDISTDSLSTLTDSDGKFLHEGMEQAFVESFDELNSANSLFELSKYCLYLPHYANINDENLIAREYKTKIPNLIKGPVSKRRFKMVDSKHKILSKEVYHLDTEYFYDLEKIEIKEPNFNIERTGFWKNIGVDEIGADKNGNEISGRTWVEQTQVYKQNKLSDVYVTKSKPKYTGKNSGNVYIMRQVAMHKDIFKIGFTRRESNKRRKEFFKTNVPDEFLVVTDWEVSDCVLAETKIHIALDKYRLSGRREFFQLSIQDAFNVCNQIILKINEDLADEK